MKLEKQGYLLIYDSSKFKVTIYRDTTIEDKLLLKNLATEYLMGKPQNGNELMKQLNYIIDADKKTQDFQDKIIRS